MFRPSTLTIAFSSPHVCPRGPLLAEAVQFTPSGE
jgi:hypothetical protein